MNKPKITARQRQRQRTFQRRINGLRALYRKYDRMALKAPNMQAHRHWKGAADLLKAAVARAIMGHQYAP